MPYAFYSQSQRDRAAFSLVELLVVIVILGILLALSAPALVSPLRGSKVNQAGQTIGDQMALARQEALTRNREMQVRFYRIGTGQDAGWRAVQIWRIETTPSGDITEIPVSRMQRLPDGIVIADDPALSPLLKADPLVSGTAKVAGEEVTYSGFRFLPTGGTDSAVSATNNFLTVQLIDEKNSPPNNFYTLQVHPLTGKVNVYRP